MPIDTNTIDYEIPSGLRVGCQNSCFVEMLIAVLPRDLSAIKILKSQAIDTCLHPKDVIREFLLQTLDAYRNPVEKGMKRKVEPIGLEFHAQKGFAQRADDQGRVNFGGLLKVIGHNESRGNIVVPSDTKILLEE
eukprot:Gb_06790 [translate_table: standard]